MIVDQHQIKQFIYLFIFYLTLTTGGKEKNQPVQRQCNLNPVDYQYKSFKHFSLENNFFFPYHLDLKNDERRNVVAESMYNFFKGIVEVSNSNFIRNVNHLLAMLSKTNDEIVCVGENNR